MASGNYVFQSDFARRHQAKGRTEGLAAGLAEGLTDGLVEALLTVLQARGFHPTDAERETIRDCTDPVQLRGWLERAVTIDSVAALLA